MKLSNVIALRSIERKNVLKVTVARVMHDMQEVLEESQGPAPWFSGRWLRRLH